MCFQGLLGDARSFKIEYEKKITAGNDKNATGRDRQIATAKAAELRAKIAPFFLRREKKDVLNQSDRCIGHCVSSLMYYILHTLFYAQWDGIACWADMPK